MDTILVVEDNDDHWFLTRWALVRTWPGIRIVRTSGRTDTIDYLTTCIGSGSAMPRLVLLDLYLPTREDGWALLDAIKQHHTLRRLPIVMLSYSENAEDIREAYTRYSTSYIIKPTSYPAWLICFQNFYRYWSQEVLLPRA